MKEFKGKLSIIIPAYNEGPHIYGNIREIQRVFDETGCRYELIIIDDGSKDETFKNAGKAAKRHKNLILKRLAENRGKGRTLKYGFRFATGDLVAFLDADLDLHPEQIRNLFSIMKKEEVDIVIGSKRHPESKINYPFHRKIISNLYFYLIKTLFGLPLRDTQTGLKLFKYQVLKEIFPKVSIERYAYDLELLANAHRLGYRIAEAPITLDFRRLLTRIRPRDLYYTLWDTMLIFWRMYILKSYNKR